MRKRDIQALETYVRLIVGLAAIHHLLQVPEHPCPELRALEWYVELG